MPNYQYTPTVDEFARVSAAAILFSCFLVKTAFCRLFDTLPKAVASGLILVLAGLVSIQKYPTYHRIAKTFGIKSHDTLEQCVMHKSFQVSCVISSIVNYLVTMLSGTPSFGYLILDDVLCAIIMLLSYPTFTGIMIMSTENTPRQCESCFSSGVMDS